MKVIALANMIGLLMHERHYQRLRKAYGEGFEQTLSYTFMVAVELDIEEGLKLIELPDLPGILKSGK